MLWGRRAREGREGRMILPPLWKVSRMSVGSEKGSKPVRCRESVDTWFLVHTYLDA